METGLKAGAAAPARGGAVSGRAPRMGCGLRYEGLVALLAAGLTLASGCCMMHARMRSEKNMVLKERTGVVTMKGKPLTLLGTEVKVGDKAPDFRVVESGFNPVKLSDFKGRTVLISAVPSLDTTVCALQTKRFNEEADKLPDTVVVLTISEDLPFAQSRFCGAEKIQKIKVLSDSVWRDFGEKYGILIQGMGLLARSVWVISPEGKVTYREVVPELTNQPDYAKALAAVK
jgi:thiol peroxidase